MLLSTHVATALAVAYIFDYWVSLSNQAYAGNAIVRVVVYVTAALLQVLLDAVGHRWVKVGDVVVPARNRLHSLPAVLAIGGAVGLAFHAATGVAELLYLYVAVMLLHWLEDLVTEGGVYLVGGRVRLPRALRLRYNSPALNRLTIAFFAALAVLYTDPLAGHTTFALFAATMAYSALSFLRV